MALWEAAWMRSLLISGKWNKVQGSWVSSSTLGRQRCICAETSTRDTMLEHVPALCMVQREHASLFGSPIGTLEGIQDTICAKKTLEALMPCANYNIPLPSLNSSMSFAPHHASSPSNYRTLTLWSDPYCARPEHPP